MMIRRSEAVGLGLLCRLLGYTRQAYYGHCRKKEAAAMRADLVLSEVSRIRFLQRRIGTRKLHHMMSDFFDEHRVRMGRDAFFELLREHHLLVRRRRPKKPRTTHSCYWMKRYPNLAKDFVPVAANQLWVSDITYIRIKGGGFCYLSLVTDAYSRKIVGYHLGRDLTRRGCVAALEMALSGNPEACGLIHHSDRGMQYYSAAYMKLLRGADIRVSMSEQSDPLENAIAERVNGILKQELLAKSFESYQEACREVARAVSTYNHLRPHLSVDMLTPAEAHAGNGYLKRRWKNYYTKKEAVNPIPDYHATVNLSQDY